MKRFSFLPLACYGALIAYTCYAWFQLGRWPYYAHPDPKELPLQLLYRITSVVLMAGALSIVLIPAGYLVWRGVTAWQKQPVPPHRRAMVVYFSGVALWVLDFSAEFARLPWTSNISWMLD